MKYHSYRVFLAKPQTDKTLDISSDRPIILGLQLSGMFLSRVAEGLAL